MLGGTGMALVFSPVANAILGAVKPHEAGQASGANNAIRELGGVLGVAVLAAVFSASGGYQSGQAFVDGLQPALFVGAAVLAVGAIAALLVPGKPRSEARWSPASRCRSRPSGARRIPRTRRPASAGRRRFTAPGEVVGGDPQPVPEVEPVGVLAVLAEARVEMELGAPAAARLVLQPGEQAVGQAAAAVALGGDEVVDVEVLAPGEELVDAEAGDGRGLLVVDANAPISR